MRLFFFFFIFIGPLKAFAQKNLITLLDNDQQQELLILMMNLAVEYQAIEPSEYSETKNTENLKSFNSILLRNFIINSAYADESKENNDDTNASTQKSANFEELEENFCIYAGGWRSIIKDNKCLSPEESKIKANLESYIGASSNKGSPSKDQCKAKNDETISCNPAIFGFQDQSRKRTFCVKNDNQNESKSCLNYALGKEFSPGADSVQDRISWLQNQHEKNKTYSKMHESIYKMCLCPKKAEDATTTPKESCFNFLAILSSSNACTYFKDETVNSNDLKLFKKLKELTSSYLSGKDTNSDYISLIKPYQDEFKEDFELLCGTEKEVSNEEKELFNCEVVYNNGKAKVVSKGDGFSIEQVSWPEDKSGDFSYMDFGKDKEIDYSGENYNPPKAKIKRASDNLVIEKTCKVTNKNKESELTIKTEQGKEEISLSASISSGKNSDWEFSWFRKSKPEANPVLAGDSDDDEAKKKDKEKEKEKFVKDDLNKKTRDISLAYEASSYSVCVEAKSKSTDKKITKCHTVPSKEENDKLQKEIEEKKPKPVGKPQLPNIPVQMRKGVDFSSEGVL